MLKRSDTILCGSLTTRVVTRMIHEYIERTTAQSIDPRTHCETRAYFLLRNFPTYPV